MKSMEAANDTSWFRSTPAIGAQDVDLRIPKGHVGPVLLSQTGRTVWWTGKVAIGLRYENPHRVAEYGESALWIQDVLRRCA